MFEFGPTLAFHTEVPRIHPPYFRKAHRGQEDRQEYFEHPAHHNGSVQLPHFVKHYIEQKALGLPLSALQSAALELSDNYRAAKDTSRIRTNHKALAYMATRMPATFAVSTTVLTELASYLPDITSVLDLGAGTGAASIAARQVFGSDAQLTLLDTDSAFFSEAKQLLPDACFIQADLPTKTDLPPADLVVTCYTLGELLESDRRAVLDRAWEACRQVLVVIEPGTTLGFKNILSMRDHLLDKGANLMAPCPHSMACPMSEPDWCHFSQRVERSVLHRKLKQGTMGYEDEKYSFVAFSKQPVSQFPGRVVRKPLYHAGFVELTLCQPGGIGTVKIKKRDKELYRTARRVVWGSPWDFRE